MTSTNRVLAALAAVLAIAALLAGDTVRGPAHNTVDALQLAGWIREQKTGLRIIDLRDRASFDEYHIPNAEWLDAATLPTASFDSTQTVVLYVAEGTSAPVHQVRGAQAAYTLHDGLRGWLTDIMSPHLPANATPEQQLLYQQKRELAEYFGGQASRYAEPPGTRTTEQLLRSYRRRGC